MNFTIHPIMASSQLNTVAGLLQKFQEDLLSSLTVLTLELNLGLHLLAHVLEHLDQRVLAVFACFLLDVKTILDLDNLLVHTLNDRILLSLAGPTLLVDAFRQAVDLVLDIASHSLLGFLAELLLLGKLNMQCQALLVKLTHNDNLELLASSLLLGDHVREAVHIVVETLENGFLAIQPVLALLINTVGDANDLICDFFLMTLLGLLAQLLLTSKVEAQCECSLINLLHDLGIEILTGTLLGSQVQGDGALDRLDLLRLALVHDLLHETLDLLVQRAQLLLLGDLGAKELVVKHLKLELGGVAASLLLVVHLILKETKLLRELLDAKLVGRCVALGKIHCCMWKPPC